MTKDLHALVVSVVKTLVHAPRRHSRDQTSRNSPEIWRTGGRLAGTSARWKAQRLARTRTQRVSSSRPIVGAR